MRRNSSKHQQREGNVLTWELRRHQTSFTWCFSLEAPLNSVSVVRLHRRFTLNTRVCVCVPDPSSEVGLWPFSLFLSWSMSCDLCSSSLVTSSSWTLTYQHFCKSDIGASDLQVKSLWILIFMNDLKGPLTALKALRPQTEGVNMLLLWKVRAGGADLVSASFAGSNVLTRFPDGWILYLLTCATCF